MTEPSRGDSPWRTERWPWPLPAYDFSIENPLLLGTPQSLDQGICLVCERLVEEWAPGPAGRKRASCPHCHSLERHRFLALLLKSLSTDIVPGSVLEVAPTESITYLLRSLSSGLYVGIDVDPSADRRRVQVVTDVTRLPFIDDAFRLIVCYHVLEHVPDDRSAMRELNRVLDRDGIALIQVPWKPNASTDEDPDAPREERIRRFGQADHVRYYGGDFEARLAETGFVIQRMSPADLLSTETIGLCSLMPNEAVWIAHSRATPPPSTQCAIISESTQPLCDHLIWSLYRTAAAAAAERAHLEARIASVEEQGRNLSRSFEQRIRVEQARADEWEAHYRWLRSRWPVQVLSSMARSGRWVRAQWRRAVRDRRLPPSE